MKICYHKIGYYKYHLEITKIIKLIAMKKGTFQMCYLLRPDLPKARVGQKVVCCDVTSTHAYFPLYMWVSNQSWTNVKVHCTHFYNLCTFEAKFKFGEALT